MLAQAYEQLPARLDATWPSGTAGEQVIPLSRTLLDFVVGNPPSQQLFATGRSLDFHLSVRCHRVSRGSEPESGSGAFLHREYLLGDETVGLAMYVVGRLGG